MLNTKLTNGLTTLNLRMFARISTPKATHTYLRKSEVPRERYMNRTEWMGNTFKNENIGAYDWVPEIITSIDPAPRYPVKAHESHYT